MEGPIATADVSKLNLINPTITPIRYGHIGMAEEHLEIEVLGEKLM